MRSWARAAIFPTAVVALLAALWAGFAPASDAPGVVAQDGPWAGEWEDTSNTWQGKPNEFQLKQSGSSVSGTYDFCNGRISGTVSGNVLRGTWNQDAPPCGGASEGSGIFEYTLAGDGKSFTGRWQYKSKCSDAATCTEWRSPWNGRKISGPSDGCTRQGARAAQASCPAPGVKVSKLEGEVVFRRKGGGWAPVTPDTKLEAGDEILTGIDSRVVLRFADGSTLELRELTQIRVDTVLVKEDRKDVNLRLKVGEIEANVKSEKAVDTSFEISDGSGDWGVRGTVFSVFYDPGSKTSLTSVTEGVVRVDPKKPGLKTVDVRAGKEIEVGAKSMSKVVGIGKAGVRKGNNRSEALDRVSAVIAKGDDPCGSTTPRKPVFGIKPDPKGWAVSVKLIGEHKGTSKWLVARKKVTPRNRLAKQIKKRCR